MNNEQPNNGSPRGKWEPPTITPLLRLGERTTPTTISASSPEMHTSDISDIVAIMNSLPLEPTEQTQTVRQGEEHHD